MQTFDTTGSGASKAAHFNVGQVTSAPNTQEGGGIFQNVTLAPGNYVLSADVAAFFDPATSTTTNDECGVFKLLLDSSTAATNAFGACTGLTTDRAHMSATVHVSGGGAHDLRVLITRPFTTSSTTPQQYVDNVVVTHVMQVSCSPGSAMVGASTTCTVSETPDRAPAPTGNVIFSTGSNGSGPDGAFSPGGCTLVASGSTSKCSVSYKPAQVATGVHTITASYGGDSTYGADSAKTTVGVTPAPTPVVTPGPVTAAQVSAAGESNSVFAVSSKPTLVTTARKHRPVGTTFKYTLSKAATVRFDFTQPAPGRKVNGKCAAQNRHNQHKRKCARTVIRGTLSFAAHAGQNSVHFFGWLSKHKKLNPGKYTLVITATTPGAGSTSQKLKFTIVR